LSRSEHGNVNGCPQSIAYPCVEDDEESAHACNDGNLMPLSGGEEAIVEGSDGWVMQSRAHRSHVEHFAHVAAPAAYVASSFALTAVVVEGSKPDERRDLLPVMCPSSGTRAKSVLRVTGPTPLIVRRASSRALNSGNDLHDALMSSSSD
jgi:hypothetical protein